MNKYYVEVSTFSKYTTIKWFDFDSRRPHRIEGPAIDCSSGYRAFFINGKMHNLNGPAIVHSNGSVSYYIDNVRYEVEDYFNEIAKRNTPPAKDPCDGKVVEFEGKKYQLKFVE